MSDAPNPIDDISIALFELRRAFAKHNIPAPDAIEYMQISKGYDAVMRLRLAASQSANWAMDATAKPWCEMSIAGFTIRFEARQIERPGTGLNLDDGESGYIFLED